MAYPADLKYTKDHEWMRVSSDVAEVGITDYAQEQLGDVVFVELPDVGRRVNAGEAFGSIESVKAVSELFAPAAGEIKSLDLSSRVAHRMLADVECISFKPGVEAEHLPAIEAGANSDVAKPQLFPVVLCAATAGVLRRLQRLEDGHVGR